MPKKKKKKGGDKDKKAKKKTGITEREAVFYEQQLHDNNLQIARLRNRNEYLEGEFEQLKGKLNQLEDDRADVIAHLKRILQQKVEEARELGERLQAMEEFRKEEQNTYKRLEETMKQDYHNMETNLNAEVKLVAGKLNALEDWRNARAELTAKFEMQEKAMAEQEERHKQTLYEAERSLIIGKAKMQKEMEERLNDLALKFQEASNIRIADATQRAIRENIALHREFDNTLKTCEELDKKMQIYKEKEENARLRASLFQKEAEMVHHKMIEQNQIIESLAEEHMKISETRSNNRRLETYARDKAESHKMYEGQCGNLQKQAQEFERKIQEAADGQIIISDQVQVDQQRINRLKDILNAVKQSISELSIKSDTVNSEVCASDPNFRQNLLNIYELLKNIEIQNRNDELLKMIEQIQNDITSTDIKTADQIAQLNCQLSVELTKINNSQKTINMIVMKREGEKKEHEHQVNSLNKVYGDTQLKLLSKLKILNAKINSLEDFKNKQTMLENKFKDCNELMAQKEKQLEERLFQIDIQFKIDREKLIEDLHKRLFELSTLWASDNENRKNPIIRGLFQENCAIQYELDQNQLEMDHRMHHYSKANPKDLNSNQGIHYRKNTMKSLEVTEARRKLIRLLKESLRWKKMQSDNIDSPLRNQPSDYDCLIDKLQTNILHSEQEVANLKYRFHNENYKLKYVNSVKNRGNKKVDEYVNTLYDVKYAIACALQIICCGSDIASMTKTQLLTHLDNLVKNK